jgi:cyclopropane-fatty-acyl-phospholipid synthase
MTLAIALAEHRLVPDALVRAGIRSQLRDRLAGITPATSAAFERELAGGPLAIEQQAANRQHYEVPPEFFALCLGPHRKYSSAWYEDGAATLGDAEAAMLARSCAHAGLADGQEILEIGCGWGSLTLWMARHYPNARILAISNSRPQREYITGVLKAEGLTNVEVRTVDVVTFDPARQFDRVVSIECFEHLRNWRELFRRISGWLRPDGRLWFHVFVHQTLSYPFAEQDESDWMSRHFFTGGMMPAYDLPGRITTDLVVEDQQVINGTNYGRTAEAWLVNLDRNAAAARRILAEAGFDPAVQLQRWRMFFMACAELWNWEDGKIWHVGHYRLRRTC